MISDHPTPWRITDTGSAYLVEDANGRLLAQFYYKRESALWGRYLKQHEARELAVTFARLSKAGTGST